MDQPEPNGERVLRVWEGSGRRHPVERALALLQELDGAGAADGWRTRALGARDAALLALHDRLFGGELCTVASCPRCDEKLETELHALQLRAAAVEQPPDTFRVQDAGYEIEARLPNSADLLAILGAAGAPHVRARALLGKCLIAVHHHGTPIELAALPEALCERIEEEMAARDPLADIRVGLRCPACDHGWELGFDIVRYLWTELDDWALRVLGQVHVLARAYGWSEAAILRLTPTRRQLYLDMVNA